MIVEFRGDGSRVKDLERALRISDHVIRHMITIAVPKPPEGEPKERRSDRGAAAEDGDDVEVSGEIDAEEIEIEDLELAAAGDEDETREER